MTYKHSKLGESDLDFGFDQILLVGLCVEHGGGLA